MVIFITLHLCPKFHPCGVCIFIILSYESFSMRKICIYKHYDNVEVRRCIRAFCFRQFNSKCMNTFNTAVIAGIISIASFNMMMLLRSSKAWEKESEKGKKLNRLAVHGHKCTNMWAFVEDLFCPHFMFECN